MAEIRRALHFVLKIGSLKKNIEFFRDKLGMKVLRHEVFDEGCEALCNGPYSNKWSKTMIGYGPEDNHFVLELTYNYSIGSYKLGNDLQYIKIDMKEETFNELQTGQSDEPITLNSPDGYKFIIAKQTTGNLEHGITEVCLSCQNLKQSIDYWVDLLKMKRCGDIHANDKEVVLGYADNQAKLRLRQINAAMLHKSAYGRIAFSCPSDQLKLIQKEAEDASQKILTPFLSLDTPGKATVQVVILADPDGHEICFVGDEGFRELSRVDPEADRLVEKSIAEDKSDEWFEKKNIPKTEA